MLRFLGAGGMGSVFAAVGPAAGEVAVKLIPPFQNGHARVRLLAEARAAAAVEHPNLVRCLDVGEHLGHPYLVMELVPGGDGDDLVRRHACLVPRERLLAIARDAAAGLAALHAAGIVHRDLKPSNLLFAADGRALVADFGLAHLDDGAPGVTRAGFTVGTPDYMPPEQARAEPLDGRADLYALGATLYHLATGRPPHTGATTWVVMGAVISEPFPDVLALRDDLGSGFGAVIAKLGAKQKDERYTDAGQLLDDLALVTAGRPPVHARYRSSVELLASGPPPDAPSVLLIDDDPLVRRIYSIGLGARGLVCIVANDGSMGLDMADRLRPAAAVVDLVLPDLDGAEVVRQLHASQPDLPIVVLSNAFAVEQLTAARTAGAVRVLPKAATPPLRLADELHALLRRPAVAVPAQAAVPPAEALCAADAAVARLQVLVRRLGQGDESMLLVELAAAAHGFAAAAGAAGAAAAATLGAATETLVRELIAQPERRSASSRRTLAQAAAALRQLVLAPGCSLAGMQVLAVDDDRMARTLLRAALDRVALRHDIVGSPEDALAKLATGSYHLLLTDVVMDHLSGFQLAARVRAMPGCAQLPIIFVTGLDDFPAFFAAGEGTGTDLIAKPYLLIELGVKALVLLATRRS